MRITCLSEMIKEFETKGCLNVKCINNTFKKYDKELHYKLTKDNVYEALNSENYRGEERYLLVNDVGEIKIYPKSDFELVK